MDWFVGMLLGHLMGDYVLQNDWIALNKKENTFICWLHCCIYTVCVCLGLVLFDLPQLANIFMYMMLFLGIFLSHVILDYTHLVDKWMKFYGIRSWNSCVPMRLNNAGDEVLDWNEPLTAKQVVSTAFGAFIYIAVDNTMHLIMMVTFIKYFILV